MQFLEMLVFYYSAIGWTKEYLRLQCWLLLSVSSIIIKCIGCNFCTSDFLTHALSLCTRVPLSDINKTYYLYQKKKKFNIYKYFTNTPGHLLDMSSHYDVALLDEYIYRCHEPKYMVVKISEN